MMANFFDPTYLVFVAAGTWLLATFVLVIGRDRFPQEFALLFALVGASVMLVAVSALTPPAFRAHYAVFGLRPFLFVGLVIFLVTPVVFTGLLFRRYPPEEPPEKPRSLGEKRDHDHTRN